jgi:hypothetical protein
MERLLAKEHEHDRRSQYLAKVGFCKNGTIDNLFQICSSRVEMIESVFEGRHIWHFLLLSPLFLHMIARYTKNVDSVLTLSKYSSPVSVLIIFTQLIFLQCKSYQRLCSRGSPTISHQLHLVVSSIKKSILLTKWNQYVSPEERTLELDVINQALGQCTNTVSSVNRAPLAIRLISTPQKIPPWTRSNLKTRQPIGNFARSIAHIPHDEIHLG